MPGKVMPPTQMHTCDNSNEKDNRPTLHFVEDARRYIRLIEISLWLAALARRYSFLRRFVGLVGWANFLLHKFPPGSDR